MLILRIKIDKRPDVGRDNRETDVHQKKKTKKMREILGDKETKNNYTEIRMGRLIRDNSAHSMLIELRLGSLLRRELLEILLNNTLIVSLNLEKRELNHLKEKVKMRIEIVKALIDKERIQEEENQKVREQEKIKNRSKIQMIRDAMGL